MRAEILKQSKIDTDEWWRKMAPTFRAKQVIELQKKLNGKKATTPASN